MANEVLIHSARVVTPTEIWDPGWVQWQGGRIVQARPGSPSADVRAGAVTVIDAERQWLVPGFIDMHVHGGGGAEVMDGTPEAIRTVARFHASHGTTAWLPTTLTGPLASIERSLSAVAEAQAAEAKERSGALILGVHLEGPFISPKHPGAQDPMYIMDPESATVERLLQAVPGLVRKITMAPERPGALDVIRALRRRGILVSIGHTDASAEETRAAIAAGATHATHLFNAMAGIHHRRPGTAGTCLVSDEVVCELICDGLHVDFDVVQLVLRVKGYDRVALITDAIGPTGCAPGRYRLGTLDILVDEQRSVLASDHGTLAGSVLTMERAVANVIRKAKASVCDAVAMASTIPARELGLAETKGRIAPGYDADLVLLDEAWTVTRTWIGGREIYCRA